MPVYFLWGDEDYSIEKRVNEIKKIALKNDINSLNYKKINNPNIATLFEILRSAGSMLGDVLNIVDISKYIFSQKEAESLDDKDLAELEKSLAKVAQNNHVIFICPTKDGKKPDSRKKMYKIISKVANAENFEKFRSYETYKVLPILKKMLLENDLKMDNNTSEKFLNAAGVSLRKIQSELEKLKLYAGSEKTITTKMVDEVCAGADNIFKLVDFILTKNVEGFLIECDKILQKQHYLELFAFLESTFSNVLKTKIYMDCNMNSFEIAKEIGAVEFIAKQNMQKVKNVDINYLVKIRQNLIDAEFKLKTGKVADPIIALEFLFYNSEANYV